MSQAQAAAGMDRLPWLSDEPAPPKSRATNRAGLGFAAVAGALLLAAGSYWIGAHSWDRDAEPAEAVRPETTVPLPQPRAAEPQTPRVVERPQPEVIFVPVPQVSPVREREVPVARSAGESAPTEANQQATAAAQSAAPATQTSPTAPPATTAPQVVQPAPVAIPKPLTAWPATQSQGAAGRIVRIGAFGTRQQAKLGWRSMVRSYPAVAHLQATVVEVRNSRGRPFYRFQIGTTSQAHSEVLCQRMEKIRLSCAVVGLPWKPKGVER